MNIAYVTLHWPRLENSGVGKKISQQISAWEKAGHDVTIYMHLHPVNMHETLIDGEYFIYELGNSGLSIFDQEIKRSRALHDMIRSIVTNKPDLIYLRWGMYAYPLQQLFRSIPTIIEINTNDVKQHRLLGPLFDIYNRLTRSITLRNASGFVFASEELSKSKEFSKYTAPYTVISNGIDLQKFHPFPAPLTDILHLVHIGSANMPWQGVEKLVTLAQRCEDIHIDIIGYDTIPNIDTLPHNLSLHGYLTKEQYEPILSKASAAIGTIALHRKGMQEASPLKVREYAAYGIPLILPYKDTDLHNLKLDTILQIPNREDNILSSIGLIHDFLYAMRGKRVERSMIYNSVNSDLKEEQRLNFMKLLV